MDKRLTDLEIRYMHQEHTLLELSDTVYRQELAIVKLEGEVRQLREQLNIAFPSLVGSPNDEEPPPHY